MSNIAIASNVNELKSYLERGKASFAAALPKHMNADRMLRIMLTMYTTNPALRKCSMESIAGSLLTASQLGLEPGVNGQAYIIPYGNTATFVPGWKGLVDLVARGGRATVWTEAVYEGDEFEYQKGSDPFVRHKEGEYKKDRKLTHVYAVGWVDGASKPIIDVWQAAKVWDHRDDFNKVGNKHYSFKHPEMYARKMPLLQVIKYLPSSIELSAATQVSHAAEAGRNVTIDGNFMVIDGAEGDVADEGILLSLRAAAMDGQSALMAKLAEIPDSAEKAQVWKEHATSLLSAAKESENGAA